MRPVATVKPVALVMAKSALPVRTRVTLQAPVPLLLTVVLRAAVLPTVTLPKASAVGATAMLQTCCCTCWPVPSGPR